MLPLFEEERNVMNSKISMRLAAVGAASIFMLTLGACSSEEAAPKPVPSATASAPAPTTSTPPVAEAPVEDYGTREGTWLQYAASDVEVSPEIEGLWSEEMTNLVIVSSGDQLFEILSDRTPLGPLPRTFDDYAGVKTHLTQRASTKLEGFLNESQEAPIDALVPSRLTEDPNVYDSNTGELLLEVSDEPDAWALAAPPTLSTITDQDLTSPGIVVHFNLTRTMKGTLNGEPHELTLNRAQNLLMRPGGSGWLIDSWEGSERPA